MDSFPKDVVVEEAADSYAYGVITEVHRTDFNLTGSVIAIPLYRITRGGFRNGCSNPHAVCGSESLKYCLSAEAGSL